VSQYYRYEVVVTAIVVRDGAYLITRRAKTKKRFPGMWTVPGGHVELKDYAHLPQDKKGYWRNVLEYALRREVREEVGIEIKNIEYVMSLATIHRDGNPSIVISCTADYASGQIKLQKYETDAYKWVSISEAKNYQLLDGLHDEFLMVEQKREKTKIAEVLKR